MRQDTFICISITISIYVLLFILKYFVVSLIFFTSCLHTFMYLCMSVCMYLYLRFFFCTMVYVIFLIDTILYIFLIYRLFLLFIFRHSVCLQSVNIIRFYFIYFLFIFSVVMVVASKPQSVLLQIEIFCIRCTFGMKITFKKIIIKTKILF